MFFKYSPNLWYWVYCFLNQNAQVGSSHDSTLAVGFGEIHCILVYLVIVLRISISHNIFEINFWGNLAFTWYYVNMLLLKYSEDRSCFWHEVDIRISFKLNVKLVDLYMFVQGGAPFITRMSKSECIIYRGINLSYFIVLCILMIHKLKLVVMYMYEGLLENTQHLYLYGSVTILYGISIIVSFSLSLK